MSFVFIAFQTTYYLTFRPRTLDSIPIGVETIIIFIYIIYYFNEKFKDPKTNAIYTNYIFWIIAGIMIYLGGSFFFNILANYIDKKQLSQYWTLTFLSDIIKNIFMTIAVFVYAMNSRETTKNKTSSIPYLDMI